MFAPSFIDSNKPQPTAIPFHVSSSKLKKKKFNFTIIPKNILSQIRPPYGDLDVSEFMIKSDDHIFLLHQTSPFTILETTIITYTVYSELGMDLLLEVKCL